MLSKRGMIDLENAWPAARQTLREVVEGLPRDPPEGKVVVVHDVDADGITAGVAFVRVLERCGVRNVVRVQPDRERNVWSPANRAMLAALKPAFLFVLDLGSRDERPLENVPTCFIDHHRPEGVPDGDTLITGYEWEPVPNTSWMVWELAQGLAPIEDLDWICVVGTLSDIGEKAPWDLIAPTKKKYTAKWLKETTALVNAPRRSANFNPEAAARALLRFDSPKELCDSDDEDVRILKTARAEVAAELKEARKAAPKFAGDVALVQIHSPCQIHPLLAQAWRGRLPKYHVLCANTGYMENRVNFSARSAKDKSVLDKLKSIELSEGEGHYGHGHDQASGGSLPPERWQELLQKLGFS